MRRKLTYIDHIDNVRRIDGFVSYGDYLQMPAVQDLAKERGITLPTVKERVREEGPVVAAQEEKKEKRLATTILGTILAVMLLGWCAVALTMTVEIGGVTIFDNGFWKERGAVLGLLLGACLMAFAGSVARFASGNEKARIFVAAASGFTCGALIGIGVYLAVTMGNIKADIAVAIVLAAAVAGVSFAALPTKKKKEKEKTE